MKSFFERYALAFAVLVGVACWVAVFAFGVHLGSSNAAQRYEGRIAAMQRDQAQALADARGQAAQDKADAEQRIAKADSQHQKELQDAQATADRTIADLRAGNLRLRDRFTCTSATAGAVRSDVAAGTGSGDATGPSDGSGLSDADAEFLVRESKRADAVLATLNACRAVVRADRGQ